METFLDLSTVMVAPARPVDTFRLSKSANQEASEGVVGVVRSSWWACQSIEKLDRCGRFGLAIQLRRLQCGRQEARMPPSAQVNANTNANAHTNENINRRPA